MNIQITEKLDKIIEGFVTIPILYGKIDLGIIPDNAAQNIVAANALDSIPYNLLKEFIESICKKMRFGCKLYLGGVELSAIARDIVSCKLNSEGFNELIFTKRGLYNIKDIVQILESNGLQIEQANIQGYVYEITASRPKITN
jgi:hypothetical protein